MANHIHQRPREGQRNNERWRSLSSEAGALNHLFLSLPEKKD